MDYNRYLRQHKEARRSRLRLYEARRNLEDERNTNKIRSTILGNTGRATLTSSSSRYGQTGDSSTTRGRTASSVYGNRATTTGSSTYGDLSSRRTSNSARSGAITSSLTSPSTSRSATASSRRNSIRDTNGNCDRCDFGDHDTDNCPHFKKNRDNHPDALNRKTAKLGATSKRVFIKNARVVRQPGDGSCLFHSLSYGIGGRSNGHKLRQEICTYIKNNPTRIIADNPIKDWIKWESNQSVSSYVRSMSGGRWGGGIEMAVCAKMKDINIHVYQKKGYFGGYERISAFEIKGARKTISVIYCGGIHYDALIVG